VDPLADLLFHPEPCAAGTAAESTILAPMHLLRPQRRNCRENIAWWRVDLVVSAEVARVVVGDVLVDRLDRGESALFDEFAEQLSVVHDLVVPAQLRVLVRDGVEAVR